MKKYIFCIMLLAVLSIAWDYGSGFNENEFDLGENDIQFYEMSSNPSTPSANFIKLYAKDDSGTTKLYTINSSGTASEVGTSSGSGIWEEVSNVLQPLTQSNLISLGNNLSVTTINYVNPTTGYTLDFVADQGSTTNQDLTISHTGSPKLTLRSTDHLTPEVVFFRDGNAYYDYRWKVDSGYFQFQHSANDASSWTTDVEITDEYFEFVTYNDVDLSNVITINSTTDQAFYKGVLINTGTSSWSNTADNSTTENLSLGEALTAASYVYSIGFRSTSSGDMRISSSSETVQIIDDVSMSNVLTVKDMIYCNNLSIDNAVSGTGVCSFALLNAAGTVVTGATYPSGIGTNYFTDATTYIYNNMSTGGSPYLYDNGDLSIKGNLTVSGDSLWINSDNMVVDGNLSVGNNLSAGNTFFVNNALGRVGIGSYANTPAALLELSPSGTGAIMSVPLTSSTCFYIAQNGNIGINTTNPNTKLGIAGDLSGSGDLSVENGVFADDLIISDNVSLLGGFLTVSGNDIYWRGNKLTN